MDIERFRKIFPVILSIILLFSIGDNQRLGAQTKVLQPKSRALYGSSKTNCTDGEYLYIGAGGTVIIGRIVSADSISLINECYFPSSVEDVYVRNKTLFVSDLITGLHILDVKDVIHPREIAKLTFPYRSYGMILDSTFLFISHGDGGVSKVDITNLSNPKTVIEAKFPCTHFRIYANYLYCINLYLITITTISTLDKVGSIPSKFDQPGGFVGLEFSNTEGILVENYQFTDSSPESILTLLDLSTPSIPKLRGSLRLREVDSFKNIGDTVFCFTTDTLYTINVNSFSTPVIMSRTPGITGDFVSLRDTILFVSRDYASDFRIINIKDITKPKKGYYLSTLADIGSVAATDSYMVAGRLDNSGLLLVDIRDISNPRKKFEYKDNIGSVRGLRIANGHIYAASEQGLKIFDVEGIDKLMLIGELNYGKWATNIDVSDTLAACGGYYYGVNLLSVANPTSPKYITFIKMPQDMVVEDIFLRDTLLFVSGDYGGIRVYSVARPAKPVLLWEKNYSSCGASYPFGKTLFVADESTIHAFDISVLDNPIELGSFDFGRRITDIYVRDSLAFVSVFTNGYSQDNGMVILDIHKLNSMKEAARANTPGFSTSVFSTANYIFFTDDLDGVYIYDRNEIITNISSHASGNIPANYKLFQNYPNPFNPTTTINFSVPKPGFVKIKVYDLLGREVSTLVNEDKPAGNYRVQFNAGKLGSGIYFYRMEAGAYSQTKKLLLLK
jgi:hypothetical protein